MNGLSPYTLPAQISNPNPTTYVNTTLPGHTTATTMSLETYCALFVNNWNQTHGHRFPLQYDQVYTMIYNQYCQQFTPNSPSPSPSPNSSNSSNSPNSVSPQPAPNSPQQYQMNAQVNQAQFQLSQQAQISPKKQEVSNMRMMKSQPLPTIAEETTFDNLNPSAPAFQPTAPSFPVPKIFEPKYPARAAYNIFIAPQLTAKLLGVIAESFPDSKTLYYYMDMSTALQINDGQMHIFEIENVGKLVFVNYDLHHRQTGQPLYGVITQNDRRRKKNNYNDKWIWKMDKMCTAEEIFNAYGIDGKYLPSSSRMASSFQAQLAAQADKLVNEMDSKVIDDTDWNDIKQIKNLRGDRDRMMKQVEVLSEWQWRMQCKKLWKRCRAIPIVVNENKNNVNQHWIEWVKLIPLQYDEYRDIAGKFIGVSCKYDQDTKQWQITSICLDKGDIENKHRLVGSVEKGYEYRQYLGCFGTTFTEIQWIR